MNLIAEPTVPKRIASPPQPQPVQLSLTLTGSAPGRLDGAWWPRSRDLTAELPLLTDRLDRRWEQRVTRVAVNPTYWPVIPRKVPVTGHMVNVGWFKKEQDPYDLLLLSCSTGRWDLLVIPPRTGPAAAARPMAADEDRGPAPGSRAPAPPERSRPAGQEDPEGEPS